MQGRPKKINGNKAMKGKGVCYDVGRVMGGNWRPVFDQKVVHRKLEIIKSELSLFMQGILPGSNVTERVSNPSLREIVKAGKHNQAFNAFLAKANKSVREVFHGQVTYASLGFEKVDWSHFDFVGVDHYRAARIRDQYASMLKPFFAYGKPVIIMELGCRTYRRADTSTEGMAGDTTVLTMTTRYPILL
jgi:hypothetical protein